MNMLPTIDEITEAFAVAETIGTDAKPQPPRRTMNPFEASAAIANCLASVGDEEMTDEQLNTLAASEDALLAFAERTKDEEEAADAAAEARNKRIKAYRESNDADANRIKRRKADLGKALRLASMDRLKSPFVSTFFRRDSSVLVECDVATLPAEFVRRKETVEPDKVKLKETWKAGGELPSGVRVQESETLVIR